MNVSGPTPISPRMDDPAAAFRLNQRFEAEVLVVAGERVTLSVAGVTIVARLTSPEQAAILTQQRRALFQVQETGPEMRLKLVKAGAPPGGEALRLENDPAAELLRLSGLPPDEINLQLARAALQNRMAVTREVITQMRGCLEQALKQEKGAAMPGGAALAHAAQTAASWAASGHVLTPAALSLLLQELPDLTTLAASLRAALAGARSRLAPQDAAHLEAALEWLDALGVDPAGEDDLAAKLQTAIRLMGRSLEAELAAEAQDENIYNERAHSGLYHLARLARTLPHNEHAALLGEIEKFLGRMNLQNLRNTPASQPGAAEHWLALEIPCALKTLPGAPEGDLARQSVHLRVLRDPLPQDPQGGPPGSRFVLQAEVAPGKTVEVDLSILARRIQVYVSTPDAWVSNCAGEELGSLNAGLEHLGYEVQDAVVGVKEALARRTVESIPASGYRRSDWRA